MSRPWICIAYLAGISILAFFVGRAMPYRWFHYDRFPYKPYPAEQEGKAYLKLKIHKWQKKVPDMSKILPGLIPPKKMGPMTPETLHTMISETCIAELIHCIFPILGLGGLLICPNGWGIAFVSVYILLGHLPFVLIQRYNRPRLVKLLHKLEDRRK